MNILALDTTTDYCSVALLTNDALIEKEVRVPQGHTRALLPLCGEILSEAGLSLSHLHGIAFARGPGAFTGVRIAVSAAQGLALGAGLPVIPVSSLAALALGAVAPSHAKSLTVATALDARMNEVYWGIYSVHASQSTASPLVPECVCAAADVPLTPSVQSLMGAGSGWEVYADLLRSRFAGYDLAIHDEAMPKASCVARLAVHESAVDPADASPVYLRDRVVQSSVNYAHK